MSILSIEGERTEIVPRLGATMDIFRTSMAVAKPHRAVHRLGHGNDDDGPAKNVERRDRRHLPEAQARS